MRSHALKIASKDFPDFYEGNLPTTCVCFPPPPRLAEAAEAAATRCTLECKCKDVQKVFMPLLKTGPLMIMDFEVSSFNCQICVTFLNYTAKIALENPCQPFFRLAVCLQTSKASKN